MDEQKTFTGYIKKIFKTILWIIGIVVILVVIGVSSTFVYKYITETIPSEKVEITVEYRKKVCTEKKFPLFIQIKNNSNKTIVKTYFDVGVKLKGRSSDLKNFSYQDYSDDKIIEPTKTYRNCWRLPKLKTKYEEYETEKMLPKLIYSIENKRIDFE